MWVLQFPFPGVVGEEGGPPFHERRLPLHKGVAVHAVSAGSFHHASFPLGLPVPGPTHVIREA